MISILIDEATQLRSYRPEDAPELFRVINGSRAHLAPWMSWVSHTTKQEHSLQFIQQSLQDLHRQDAVALGIFRNQQIIGGIGMHNREPHLKRAQIGYWIAKEYEGQGIITTCGRRFVDFLFEKLGLNKIELHFARTNARSAAVAARLGAQTEGIIRAGCLVSGLPEDLVVTGILRSEWIAGKK
jgi:ribosomal-protein-serine acetyltransferase